ncbi:endonuclease Q family protein [Patescibacteria group bacterium]
MKVIADLHLHSKYSRAVSQQMIPQVMAEWAVKKGINLLGTSDWTHALWLKELEASFNESSNGVYSLKNSKNNLSKVKFILATEISSIYSQGGKTRRIHNVVFIPSFKIAYKINKELKSRGCNLMSDGRPIIGLSSIELAELIWSIDKNCIIVPAHIWTPWFSMFGSKSGFDSVSECWGKYEKHIYAIETGLSSDPTMNWLVKDLDTRSILSFSDAHSPAKLGRETTVFELEELSFENLRKALKARLKPGKNKILYTTEFYPEEGKYHYTGHRKCSVKHTFADTLKKGTTCPVCGKPLTLGVMHRVSELAKNKSIEPIKKENKAGLIGYYNPEDKTRPPYVMLVPLMEIIAESFSIGVGSKKVANEYENIIKNLGTEIDVLTQTKIEKIAKHSGDKIAQGIDKVRKGDIVVDPGFDGVFGVVKIWHSQNSTSDEKQDLLKSKEQMSFF